MAFHPALEELLGIPNVYLPGRCACYFVDHNWNTTYIGVLSRSLLLQILLLGLAWRGFAIAGPSEEIDQLNIFYHLG
jgi:hypothetical protein